MTIVTIIMVLIPCGFRYAGALCLISPYTSIKEIVEDHVGSVIGMLAHGASEWNSAKLIEEVTTSARSKWHSNCLPSEASHATLTTCLLAGYNSHVVHSWDE